MKKCNISFLFEGRGLKAGNTSGVFIHIIIDVWNWIAKRRETAMKGNDIDRVHLNLLWKEYPEVKIG